MSRNGLCFHAPRKNDVGGNLLGVLELAPAFSQPARWREVCVESLAVTLSGPRSEGREQKLPGLLRQLAACAKAGPSSSTPRLLAHGGDFSGAWVKKPARW